MNVIITKSYLLPGKALHRLFYPMALPRPWLKSECSLIMKNWSYTTVFDIFNCFLVLYFFGLKIKWQLSDLYDA